MDISIHSHITYCIFWWTINSTFNYCPCDNVSAHIHTHNGYIWMFIMWQNSQMIWIEKTFVQDVFSAKLSLLSSLSEWECWLLTGKSLNRMFQSLTQTDTPWTELYWNQHSSRVTGLIYNTLRAIDMSELCTKTIKGWHNLLKCDGNKDVHRNKRGNSFWWSYLISYYQNSYHGTVF